MNTIPIEDSKENNDEQANDLMPIVQKPSSPIPLPLIFIFMAVAGILLFWVLISKKKPQEIYTSAIGLNQNYNNNQSQNMDELYIPPPPAEADNSIDMPDWNVKKEVVTDDVKKATLPQPTSTIPAQRQLQIPQPMQQPPQQVYYPAYTPPPPLVSSPPQQTRVSNDAALIYDRNATSSTDYQLNNDPNKQNGFSGSPATTSRATAINNKTNTITQGTFIPAVLETALDSSKPGPARALVTRDIKGFDGKRILIPRGSRLIGEYRTDISPRQTRALVIWNRLITPNGATITLASPTSDNVGNIGVAGSVNNHFWERFGSTFLQSTLQAGVNYAGRSNNTSIIIANPSSIQGSNGSSAATNQYQPTLKVKQGTIINVIVAQDLDFSKVTYSREK